MGPTLRLGAARVAYLLKSQMYWFLLPSRAANWLTLAVGGLGAVEEQDGCWAYRPRITKAEHNGET